VAHFLASRGFDNVANIAGGIHAWSAEVDPPSAPTESICLPPLRKFPMNRTRTLRRFPLLPLLVALGTGFAGMAQAQSLVELFDAAKSFDATYQSARSQAEANLAKGEQARAGLLPTVGLGAGITQTSQDSSLASLNGRNYGAQSATLSASQPLYRPANAATYEQGKKQADISQAQLLAAEQDLIVRVSQAYFDVLAATDSLTYVRSLKAATAEQLASAKRNFEVALRPLWTAAMHRPASIWLRLRNWLLKMTCALSPWHWINWWAGTPPHRNRCVHRWPLKK